MTTMVLLLSMLLSLYLLFYVVYNYLYLPPPSPLYAIFSLSIDLSSTHLSMPTSSSSSLCYYLSIYCSILYTSICAYLLLLLLSMLLCLYILIYVVYSYLYLPSPPLFYFTISLSIVPCCIQLSVPTSFSSSLCYYSSFY